MNRLSVVLLICLPYCLLAKDPETKHESKIKKHGLALSAGIAQYTYYSDFAPVSYIVKQVNHEVKPYSPNVLSLAYYYKNKFSLQLSGTTLNHQSETYYKSKDADPFLESRSFMSIDACIGYNFLRHSKHFSAWLYGGVGYGDYSYDEYQQSPVIGFCAVGNYYKFVWKQSYYPLAQAVIKYNPIRNVFVGVGGGYRRFDDVYQTFSACVILGFQL